MKLANLERHLAVALAALVCVLLWMWRPKPQEGSTAILDFPSRFGKHHVLMPLGSLEERDAAIKRHIDDFLALKRAVEEIP